MMTTKTVTYDVQWLVRTVDECMTLAHLIELWKNTEDGQTLCPRLKKEAKDFNDELTMIGIPFPKEHFDGVEASQIALVLVPVLLELKRRTIELGELCDYREPLECGEILKPLGLSSLNEKGCVKEWKVSDEDLLKVLVPFVRKLKTRLDYLEDWCN